MTINQSFMYKKEDFILTNKTILNRCEKSVTQFPVFTQTKFPKPHYFQEITSKTSIKKTLNLLKSIIMKDILYAILVFGIFFFFNGRKILEKKGIKVPKWIDYPLAFSLLILTIYIVYDTFFQLKPNKYGEVSRN